MAKKAKFWEYIDGGIDYTPVTTPKPKPNHWMRLTFQLDRLGTWAKKKANDSITTLKNARVNDKLEDKDLNGVSFDYASLDSVSDAKHPYTNGANYKRLDSKEFEEAKMKSLGINKRGR